MEPLVSIIIPVYCGANYMKEAIDSALEQTYKNIEVIVINDGSDDAGETERIALQYGEKIRYYRKQNGGSSSALNYGISKMNGEYFSWLSHDDVYFPEKIEKEVRIAKSSNQLGVVICDSMLIDATGKKMWGIKSKLKGEKTAKESFSLFLEGHGINGCAVLVPRKIIEDVGLFDEEMIYLNDWDYWWRIMFSGANFVYLDEQLVKCRIHSQQVSARKKHFLEIEKHYIIKKALNLLGQLDQENFFFYKNLLFFCTAENLTKERRYIHEMLKKEETLSLNDELRLCGVWCIGRVIQTLKKIRRKILFHR